MAAPSAFGDIGGMATTGASLGAIGGPWGAGIGAGIGGLVGLGKYLLSDKPNYERAVKNASITQRYSPWTGQWQNAPSDAPSAIGDVGGGVDAGLRLVGEGAQQGKNAEMQDAYIALINRLGQGAGSSGSASTNAQAGAPSLNGPINGWKSSWGG